jgi:hypothetical protein
MLAISSSFFCRASVLPLSSMATTHEIAVKKRGCSSLKSQVSSLKSQAFGASCFLGFPCIILVAYLCPILRQNFIVNSSKAAFLFRKTPDQQGASSFPPRQQSGGLGASLVRAVWERRPEGPSYLLSTVKLHYLAGLCVFSRLQHTCPPIGPLALGGRGLSLRSFSEFLSMAPDAGCVS